MAALREQSAPGKPAGTADDTAGRMPGGIPTMHVKVYSPYRVYFDEPAVSITADNAAGTFDILPRHHNFITLLEPCILEVVRAGRSDRQRIKISGGLMHVKADTVTIFLDV